jgi:uncharacterized membrane protein
MFSPLQLIFLLILLSILIGIIQVGAFSIAFDKVGLSQSSALLILLSSFVGSLINIPLFKMAANEVTPMRIPYYLRGFLKHPPRPFLGHTQIYVNMGGCLIPLTVSTYVVRFTEYDYMSIAVATLLMSLVSYFFSRPIKGVGIGMPLFIAPLAAALIAMVVAPAHSAPIAYISGTLGVLIGADLLRLKDIKHMGSPVASIGGAGTFDGIFITGIVAALLA